MSHFETHAGFFRLLMEGIFYLHIGKVDSLISYDLSGLVGGGKGYFRRHPSNLFYLKGIGVGYSPMLESVDEHQFLKN